MKRARVGLFAASVAIACSKSPSVEAPPLPTHPSATQNANADALLAGPDWYRYAVFYEVNVRSFQDSNGDGIGDLAGLVTRLDYLKDLGVDALWLMPTFPTGFKDSGYDISDYEGVNPDYGDIAALDRVVTEAHARKMRVFLDLVLNHTSDLHPWFQDSRASKAGDKADWYVWSDTAGRADIGSCKPDNAQYGDGWTLDAPRNQYFFHRFTAEQPDLDYRNPDVVTATLDVARFWLARGIDGYRCDVIGKLFESPTGCDMIPETVDYIKKLRGVANEFDSRAMVAEPSSLDDAAAYFGSGSDMFHMAFDFGYGYFWGLAFSSGNKTIIENAITTNVSYPANAQAAQVIGSHDVARAWQSAGQTAWRLENAALMEMTLKGTPFIYYGDEVGLHPGTQIVVDLRDWARTPMTWTSRDPGHGFTTGTPWIAFGDAPETTGVDSEDADPSSVLTFYRQLLAFRRGHAVWGTGTMRLVSLDSDQIVAFVRQDANETYFIAVNLTEDDQVGTATDPLPNGGPAVFGAGSLAVSGGAVTVKLAGKGAAIFAIH